MEVFRLRTDSSEYAWGAQLCRKNGENHEEVAVAAQPWNRQEIRRHITHKEAMASARGVQQLAHLIPEGANLLIQTDASSTAITWKKGSKKRGMNKEIKEQLMKLQKSKIHIIPSHIAGVRNVRADWLSRHPDPLNYQLNPKIFRAACNHFHFRPQIDLFASKSNHQLPMYHSWWMDKDSLGNAWDSKWTRPSWANPPWEMISKMLDKVQQDRALVLVCLPVWKSAKWWPKMLEMQKTEMWIWSKIAMYKDPEGHSLPPPRWPTLFTILGP